MNKEEYIQNLLENGFKYNSIVTNYFLSDFSNLNIDSEMKNFIAESITQKKDFKVDYSELKFIVFALENRIENLLNDDSFNPFKEELRKKFPEQYSSLPFTRNGVTYYLYPKGFDIDSLILSVWSFMETVQKHIVEKKDLKYIYNNGA